MSEEENEEENKMKRKSICFVSTKKWGKEKRINKKDGWRRRGRERIY